MRVTRLDIRNLRGFSEVQLFPGPALNFFSGDNGAGKTSVLEALHLMAYGRSFRGRVRDGLVRNGEAALEVFLEWNENRPGPSALVDASDLQVAASERKAGLRHSGQDWSGRLDGENVTQLGELCAALAVITFEPGSHALITGPSELRRRFLDWGLFHVERDFFSTWRRYSRALKQRNALLKTRVPQPQLDAWDAELVHAGEPLSRYRQVYLDALQPHFVELMREMAPALGESRLDYVPGWRRDEMPFADALLLARDRDLQAGFTSVGPHRADWRIDFGSIPGRDALSRGQAKLTALSALLSQAEHFAADTGQQPIIAFDDLASELDRGHQQRVLSRLIESGAQVFITGTEIPAVLAQSGADFAMFHVEQGVISTGTGNIDNVLGDAPWQR
ncbi:DNA replication/repair protein RecF [Lysobacter sp. H23M47]|uniref:DNA replication/repair protein RecF n=1 Tax=Lysobacter sp. H23M47 TaxID=2781024 RepID=UPI00187F69EE|nr:DNA replication/repair protein RecF [Lysobacter sp. H23M47]QOW24541.1 DNA replication/repair protein RecF [Lysobacter sp. H23M47]